MALRSDESPARVRIGLVGGGKGGSALLDLVLDWPAAQVTVIIDPRPDAPAVDKVKALGIPIATHHLEVFAYPVDLVLEVTGQPAILDELLHAKPSGVEVIGAGSLRFFWELLDDNVRLIKEMAEWNRTLERRVQEQVAQVERLGRLKRFFSPHLAELIVAGGAGDPLTTHRRDITVVFLDLRGFTSFAETAEPEEVMGVLRQYHAEVGRLVLDHEGTLERFAGDGMMIFFNDPVPVPNPAERAIRMAVAMRDRVKELGAAWRKLGYDLALGVGIAQGYATIGAIGFEGRWDYGAIGTVTNLAARLCGEAKGDQILVPARVAGAVEDLADIEQVGPLLLKGFLKPVQTFNVLGLKGSG